MRLFRSLVLLMLAGCAAFAGSPAPASVVVRVWQSQDGLPSNVVRSVVQASDGYLWVATAEGLARFDGFEFRSVEPEGDLKPYQLLFSRLFATAGGDVWAATFRGGLFRIRKEKVELVLANLKQTPPPLVTQMIEDDAGGVWYKRGTEYGRIRSDGRAETGAADEAIIGKFAADLKRQAVSGRVVDATVQPVLKDRAGRIWTALSSGSLTLSEDGRAGEGVEFPQRGQIFGVNEMMLDREGNVWVASPTHGLARVHPALVEVPEMGDPTGADVYSALMEDHQGVLWIAKLKGGLTRWQAGGCTSMEFANRPAAAMFEDREQRLWLATLGGSVYLGKDGVFAPQFLKSQVPSKVRSITQDTSGTLWFGGSQGLSALAGGTVKSYGKAEGVGDLDITVLRPLQDGRVLAGTSTGVVLAGGAGGFVTVAAADMTDHHWISEILPVSATEVWVSTIGSGLFLWNGKTWIEFGFGAGIPDPRLTCVMDDGRGFFWLGSLSGIIRVERRELLARCHDPERPVHWLRLDQSDGLPSRECIGHFHPAGCRARDGVLWFPTGGGLVRVRPERVGANPEAPPVYLQSVLSNGELIPGDAGAITTSPGRARLEFRFVGLSFSAPEKTTYRARLAGLDDMWRELGGQRVAAYEAVPPGSYVFEVMAVSGNGVRSPQPARIQVYVRPHPWQTAWFYISAGAFVLLAAVGVGWFAARRRMKVRIQTLRIQGAREAERSRIARDLHDDLGASLAEISILSSLAAEDAEDTPLQASLDQLSAKAKHVISSLDEIVWAVNPREDTLRSLVDYLAAFSREILDLARISLRVDAPVDIPDCVVASTRRHAVFLATREAIHNIVKHSGAREVQLRITIDGGRMGIRIQDNGVGFEPDYVSGGNGLGNLRLRMQEAGGECRIETFRMQGTTVILDLPLVISS